MKRTFSGYSKKSLGGPILYPSSRIGIPHRLHFQYGVADALCLGSAEIREATRFKDRPAALRPEELVIVASHVTEKFEELDGRLGGAMYNVSIASSVDEGVRDTEVNSRSERGLQTTHWMPSSLGGPAIRRTVRLSNGLCATISDLGSRFGWCTRRPTNKRVAGSRC